MKIGMIGLGRMGANMVRRLMQAGHECVVFDPNAAAVADLVSKGAVGAASATELLTKLGDARVVWIMIPAGAVDNLIQSLRPMLKAGDILIDGGNSYYGDDIRRAKELASVGVHYIDVGTSGGIWGLERGYCLMIGGEDAAFARVEPILAALASGSAPAAGAPPATSTAARGYLHVGPTGAGHFVKMVHNGIEYGLMAAYAEGFNLLHRVSNHPGVTTIDAETAPVKLAGDPKFDFKLDEISELWRHGSVVSSWLLDLVAQQLATSADLGNFSGNVADSGEGRWTIEAAINSGVPVPVLATALFARFTSRGESDFANRMLSAMRLGFGGHVEKKTP